MIVPWPVSGCSGGNEMVLPDAPGAETAKTFDFASPKSISLVPDFVSMMFPGFKSR